MMLRAEKVSVRYKDLEAVKQVSFTLEEGQWLMLVGPNGAGKSTLIKALSKTLPYTGKIALMDRDIAKLSQKQIARGMAVLRQSQQVNYAFTVEELVRLGRYAHQSAWSKKDEAGSGKVEEALQMCGLYEMRKQNVLTLSGGELQRAFLAQVFAQDAPILLLDEPVNHLDLAYQQSIFDLVSLWLKKPGRAVISVVHDLLLARRYGTHALLMREGSVAALGGTEAVFTRETLESVYCMDVGEWFKNLYQPWGDGQNGAT
ncbi:MAG: ABC transporter ATP-binding protein [Bacillota bacterium]|nr:ABC transporter ATP-binding protein [Bacillota bacterium]